MAPTFRLKNSHLYLAIYGLWLLMPLIPMVSPWAVSLGMSANVAAWLPLIFGFVAAPLLQVSIPASLPVLKPNEKLGLWRIYLDSLLIASVPLQVLMLFVSTDFWSSGQLDLIGSIAYLAGVGAFSGFCAVNIGHELIHYHVIPSDHIRRHGGFLMLPPSLGAFVSKFLASLLLSSVWFASFSAAHLKIHHLHVGTPKDCYTAKRGQSIYSFTLQALASHFKRTISIELEMLESQGKTLISSSIFSTMLFSIILSIVFYIIWGLAGLIFFSGQAIIAIILIEWIDYLQHYGIVRVKGPDGHIEPVNEWHSWNDKSWVMDIFLINVFRHSDHHMNPNKPFYLLSDSSIAPTYPYPVSVMMLISLFPSLFYRVAHRVLDSHPILGRIGNSVTVYKSELYGRE
jgi:alkane 1-monooxygenase